MATAAISENSTQYLSSLANTDVVKNLGILSSYYLYVSIVQFFKYLQSVCVELNARNLNSMAQSVRRFNSIALQVAAHAA